MWICETEVRRLEERSSNLAPEVALSSIDALRLKIAISTSISCEWGQNIYIRSSESICQCDAGVSHTYTLALALTLSQRLNRLICSPLEIIHSPKQQINFIQAPCSPCKAPPLPPPSLRLIHRHHRNEIIMNQNTGKRKRPDIVCL